MKLTDLQALVASSHDHQFGTTQMSERLRDLSHQVATLVHAPDPTTEIGDLGWALLQLCNETDTDLQGAIEATCGVLDATVAGKKVAIIGTSANPITNGHLTLGMEILALTDVDEVWYMLVGQHAWGKKLMPAEHRLEMARRATARYPKLKVCDFEIAHAEEIYAKTNQTAEILRDFLMPAFPRHQFRWVMGSDVAQTFHEWGESQWMAENMAIYIIHRLGFDFAKAESILADDRHQYLREDIVTSNISSSLVRERGKDYEGSRLLALVPEVVWDYLEEHKLL